MKNEKKKFKVIIIILLLIICLELFISYQTFIKRKIIKNEPNASIKINLKEKNKIYSYVKKEENLTYIFEYIFIDDNILNFCNSVYNNQDEINTVCYKATSINDEENNLIIRYENNQEYTEIKCKDNKAVINSNSDYNKYLTGIYNISEVKIDYGLKQTQLSKYETDKNTAGFEMSTDLAQAIREELGMAKDELLTKEILENITVLRLWNSKLTSLKGIEYVKNLKYFYTSDTYLTDIKDLTKLEYLSIIQISGGSISEIPDFSHNLELEELDLAGNQISSIEPVLLIPNLKILNLSDNNIHSISSLNNKYLESLVLDNNPILDYSSIKDNRILRQAWKSGFLMEFETYLKGEEKAKEIISTIIKEGMSDLEKELVIYQYIIDNMEYDIDYNRYVPSYYAFLTNTGVCGHYADTMTLLGSMAGLDIKSIVSSTHAWNMIKIDNKYYHLDVLWDDDEYSHMRYFNRSSNYILSVKEHTYDLNRYSFSEEDMHPILYTHLTNNEISRNTNNIKVYISNLKE